MAFVGLGFYSLRASNRAEKNRIWAGLAKETAHQLGTLRFQLSLLGLELLESANADEESNKEIYREMKKDVDRLNLIADRFGKIGSRPVLKTKRSWRNGGACSRIHEETSQQKSTICLSC